MIISIISIGLFFIALPYCLLQYCNSLLEQDDCYSRKQTENISPPKTIYRAITILEFVKYFPGFYNKSFNLIWVCEENCTSVLIQEKTNLQIEGRKKAKEAVRQRPDYKTGMDIKWQDGLTNETKEEFCTKWAQFQEFMTSRGKSIPQYSEVCK